MAFTNQDLINIEEAIIDLAIGKRVVSVDVAGKTRQFQSTSLDKLIALRSIIKNDLAAASGEGFVKKINFVRPD